MGNFQCEECDALFLSDRSNANCPFCGSGAVGLYTGKLLESNATGTATATGITRRTSSRIRRRPVEDSTTEEEEEESSSEELSDTNMEGYTDNENDSEDEDSDESYDSDNGRRVRIRFTNVFSPSPSDFAAHIFNLVQTNLNASDSNQSHPLPFAGFTINFSGVGLADIANLDTLLNAVFNDLMASNGGNAPPRSLSEEKINSLPACKADEKHKECAICRDDFSAADEDLAKLPACEHVFHRECIGSWLKRVATCPICRKSVE